MAVASSNRTSLRYSTEASYGVTPADQMRELRTTGETLKLTLSNTASKELNDSRQVTDLVQTGAECGGGINFELSGDTYNDFIQACIGGTWGTATSITDSTAISFTAGTGAANKDKISGTGLFTNIAVGQWILVSGAAVEMNNGLKQVEARTNDQLTLTTFGAITTAAAGDTVSIKAKMIRNPSTGADFVARSFSIERKHDDVQKYFIFRGMRVNTLSMKFATGSIIDGSIEFLGKNSAVQATSFVAANIPDVLPATTTKVLNAITDVETSNILIDGEAVESTYISNVSVNISNNLRGIKAIGYKGNAEIAEGQLAVTGNLDIYFNDTEFYNKYTESSEFSISYSVLNKETGKGYVFTFPRCMISSDDINATGTDQDVVEGMGWQALRCANGYTVQVDAF